MTPAFVWITVVSALAFASGSTAKTLSAAVDVAGAHNYADQYAGSKPPWIADITKSVAPKYPYEDRTRHHEGAGVYRLLLDLKSGSVAEVSVVSSAGFRGLDASALAALRQWRWRPGRWKQIDIPVRFTMSGFGPGHASNPLPHIPPSGGGRGLSGRP